MGKDWALGHRWSRDGGAQTKEGGTTNDALPAESNKLMAVNEAPQSPSSGQRWRRRAAAAALLGLLLVAGAIALGVVYSHNGAGSATANSSASPVAAPADVAQVLDALKAMEGAATDAASTATAATTPVTVVTPDTASKDGVDTVVSADSAAGTLVDKAAAAANKPVGVLQTLAAQQSTMMGMRICYPSNGAELVSTIVGCLNVWNRGGNGVLIAGQCLCIAGALTVLPRHAHAHTHACPPQGAMVNGTTCQVILLTKGGGAGATPYTVNGTMHVTTSKIIIGHPIDIPIIKVAKGVERMFDGEEATERQEAARAGGADVHRCHTSFT